MQIGLQNYEFYRTPFGGVMIKKEGESVKEYLISDRGFTTVMLEYIKDFYPLAFEALSEIYSKVNFHRDIFEYKAVHRFIRCNFGNYDQTNDIDQLGIFRFEDVECPLAGECKYHQILCTPKFETTLTKSEEKIMRMIYNTKRVDEIAENLHISIETVKKHKRNALLRLGLHSEKEFISYAFKNNLFNE